MSKRSKRYRVQLRKTMHATGYLEYACCCDKDEVLERISDDLRSRAIHPGRVREWSEPIDVRDSMVVLKSTLEELPNDDDWTVLLLRPDYDADTYGQDTFMTHVQADSAEEAIREAQGQAVGQECTPEDYVCLACIRGKHVDRRP